MKIFAKAFGRGPDIVLIHGWGFNSAVWSSLASILAEKFRVNLVDLPGFGLSASLTAHAVNPLQQFAQAVLSVTPEHAHYVGWSLGGLVATCLASLEPHRIGKLITLACNPKFIATSNWPGMSPEIFQDFKKNLTLNCRDTLQRFAYLIMQGSDNQRELLRQVKPYLSGEHLPSEGALQTALTILETSDLRQSLTHLECHQLHILGEQDKLIPSQLYATLQQLLPQAHIQPIPKASHVPFMSHPQRVADGITKFIYA